MMDVFLKRQGQVFLFLWYRGSERLTTIRSRQTFLIGVIGIMYASSVSYAQTDLGQLHRGLIALHQDSANIFVSWRLLKSDGEKVAFNLFRKQENQKAKKLNRQPISQSTNWVDETADLTQDNYYYVETVRSNQESGNTKSQANDGYLIPANSPNQPYFSIPLNRPDGGTTRDGVSYTYSPNDASVGDLDGDGELEIVLKWNPSNAQDNSRPGFTGNVYLDAYEMDGSRLWRIDLGKNIRAGAHYTQFMVYDLDQDGLAEVACKTGDGTMDGQGKVIGEPGADWRNAEGYILSGPEYLTVFNGRSGAALSTVNYVPPRHPTIKNPTPQDIKAVWGDDYGNRIDRFLAAVAYVDGQAPSLVMCRGYYTRMVLVAWDFKNGRLTQKWKFDSDYGSTADPAYRGQGNHNLAVADVDQDGKDEIVYGSATIDDDGTGLYSTRLGHGDALHLSDMDPKRAGLEVFQPHEEEDEYGPNAMSFRDARTGEVLWGGPGPEMGDNGRGVAADVDPGYIGYEAWSSEGAMRSARGEKISEAKPSVNFLTWWDGDLSRELLDGTHIDQWNFANSTLERLISGEDAGATRNNGTKANPVLSADLLGDWREEVIWRHSNNEELLVYSTTIPTDYRFYTLLQDHVYRLAVAWQNVAYNQPPHPGFYLGTDMTDEQLRVAGHTYYKDKDSESTGIK